MVDIVIIYTETGLGRKNPRLETPVRLYYLLNGLLFLTLFG